MRQPIAMSQPACCQLVAQVLAIIEGIERERAHSTMPPAAVMHDQRIAEQVSIKRDGVEPAVFSNVSVHQPMMDFGSAGEHGAQTVIGQRENSMDLADKALAYPELFGEYA